MVLLQCRFCGETKKIKYLFDKTNLKLVKMAMAIYPIVIHQSDPLPKYFCEVCHLNISKEYKNRQNIIALNNARINNLRVYEPQHGYLSLLNTIEDIKKFVIENNKLEVKGLLKQCVERMLCCDKADLSQEEMNTNSKETLTELNTKSSSKTLKESPTKSDHHKKSSVAATSVPAALSDTITDTGTTARASTTKKSTVLNSMYPKKSACTFATYGGTTIKIKAMPKVPRSKATTNSIAEVEQHLLIDKQHSGTEKQRLKTKKKLIATVADDEEVNNNLKYKCNFCQHVSTSEVDLIQHKTNVHFTVKLIPIFQKKTLPPPLRRGRIMKVDEEQKLIVCHSCYRVYENKDEILEHWKNYKCDFYCLICSKTFPDSPKSLREHVRTEHNLSHSQLRLLFENNKDKGSIELTPEPLALRRTVANAKCTACCGIFVSKEAREQHMLTHQPNYLRKEKPTVKTNIMDKKHVCKICSRVFEHIRALNGHMRIHKPTYKYGSLTLPTDQHKEHVVDKYVNVEVDPKIVIKNELISEEEGLENQEITHGQEPTINNNNLFINSLSPSSQTTISPSLLRKGLVKVKSMQQLMGSDERPPKLAKLDISPN